MQKYISAQHSFVSLALSSPAQGFLPRNAIPAISTILHHNALGYNAYKGTMHQGTLHVGRLYYTEMQQTFYVIFTYNLELVKYISIFTREKLSNNLVLIYVQLWFCGGFNLNPDIQTDWLWWLFLKLFIYFFFSRSHWSNVLNSKLLSEMLRFLGF